MKIELETKVIIIALLVFLFFVVLAKKMKERPVLNTWVTAYAWSNFQMSGEEVGGYCFHVYKRWGEKMTTFYNYGFDESLDLVKTTKSIDPNSSDWDLWLSRYEAIKREAIDSGYPNNI
ncbi:hypothetical protein KKA24_01665 [Patescibacteria group bacterium]|nr:hypothetical protein [Patescibacteria group bacterium]